MTVYIVKCIGCFVLFLFRFVFCFLLLFLFLFTCLFVCLKTSFCTQKLQYNG